MKNLSVNGETPRSTDQIIEGLSKDLTEFKPFRMKTGVIGALLVLSFIAIVSGVILPIRSDLVGKSRTARFVFESMAWLGIALASVVAFVRSGFPGRSAGRERKLAFLFVAVVVGFLGVRFAFYSSLSELKIEMDAFRGRCGPIIFFSGLISSFGMGLLARKLAPTEPKKTALWIALGSGAFASFIMQFVCDHENAWHILIWHMTPIVLLCWVCAWAGQRALSW